MPPVRKFSLLPAALQKQLRELFVANGFGNIEAITAQLNLWCQAEGVPMTFGKSAVGEESKRVRRAQEAIRATTEAARQIAETSPDDADQRSAGAMAIVQSEVFELLLQVRESEDIKDPVARLAVMNDAALGLSRLSRARVNQARWQVDVDARVKAAADNATKLARQGGLSEETIAEIKAGILGIVPRSTAQAGG